ncbi:hypothetical protein [Herbidospora sp. RD11066]
MATASLLLIGLLSGVRLSSPVHAALFLLSLLTGFLGVLFLLAFGQPS